MVFNPILCYLPPKIVICQELLIAETPNKCHWIWHTLNLKYAPLKPFWCIFPSQNQQNVKFLPEVLIFQELLITETRNLQHWIGMPQTLNMCHSSHFDAFFSVKINKIWTFSCYFSSSWQKWKKKHQFEHGKSVRKGLKICTLGFWVCQLQWTMWELCVTSPFWVMRVFLYFDRKV